MKRFTYTLAALCLLCAAAAVCAQPVRTQPRQLAFFTYKTFMGMIDPGSAFAERLGLTSAQKNGLSRLNREYLDELNADKELFDLFDKAETERREAMARERFLRYDGDVKRLLTAGQKSRYEALKRQRAIDSIANEFYYHNIRSFDSAMLQRLNLADWQESRLAALNEAFEAKMAKIYSEGSTKAAYRRYNADLRAMLSREQNEVFDDVLYSLSREAVPEGFAKGLPSKPAPPAEVYKDPEEEPVKYVPDPKVGFPGMHHPASTYMRELELSPEELKRLDALNRKYTRIFSDKYMKYAKDFLKHADTKEPEYFRESYKVMLEENKSLGAKYEEAFRQLLYYDHRITYAQSPTGKSLKGYAFMYRGGGYGLFYDADFLRSVRLTEEQKEALLALNRDAAGKMLTLKYPGDRGRVYAEYEKAVTDMLDEEQRHRFAMIFSSSGIDWRDVDKKRKERGPLFNRTTAYKLFDQAAEKVLERQYAKYLPDELMGTGEVFGVVETLDGYSAYVYLLVQEIVSLNNCNYTMSSVSGEAVLRFDLRDGAPALKALVWGEKGDGRDKWLKEHFPDKYYNMASAYRPNMKELEISIGSRLHERGLENTREWEDQLEIDGNTGKYRITEPPDSHDKTETRRVVEEGVLEPAGAGGDQ